MKKATIHVGKINIPYMDPNHQRLLESWPNYPHQSYLHQKYGLLIKGLLAIRLSLKALP